MNTKTTFIALLVVAMLSLLGCGGSGGTSTPSPFAGRWIGAFATSDGESGTADITIATSGAATGAVHNNTFNTDGSLTGDVENSGQADATIQYPNQPPADLSGTVTIDGQGDLVGTLAQSTGGTVTFDLSPQ